MYRSFFRLHKKPCKPAVNISRSRYSGTFTSTRCSDSSATIQFPNPIQMFKTRNDVLHATGIPASAWYTKEQYATAQKNPVIHHFLGHTLGRPWYRESLNPLRPLYQKIAAEAGLPEVAEQSRPIDFCYKVQDLAWKTLPASLFPWTCRAMYAYFFKTRYGV